jgi:LemA protein
VTVVLWFVAILIIGAVAAVALYNGLVRLRNLASNAWSDIDVQLKRRHDLVPNVVEAVKGYAGYERATLDAVVAARSRAMTAQGPAARGAAEGALVAALGGVFGLAEAFPQLRAVENFGHLQETLVQIEDAIQNARRYYNAVVRDFNTKIQQFPANLVAAPFGFTPREFFQLETEGERAVPSADVSGIR